MVTRFELGNQFVELTLNGANIDTRWGATGRVDRQRTVQFSNEHEAAIGWSRQLRRLEHRGYRPGRSNAQLEAVIRANPNDANAYLVYADWLQEQNDARGLFISSMVRGQPYEHFFDEHAVLLRPNTKKTVNYTWRFGFIDSATFIEPTWATVRRVLRHPSSMLMRSLIVQSTELGESPPAWNALLSLLPPTLERIEFGESTVLWALRKHLAPELQKLLVG